MDTGQEGWLAYSGGAQLHLDSAMRRKDAHRFYGVNAMQTTGYHFHFELDPRVPWKS